MLLNFHFCFIRCVCECAFAIWIKSLVELSSHFTSLVQIHSLVSLWARYFSCWISFYFSLPFSLSRAHNPILSFTWYCFVSCCVVSRLVTSRHLSPLKRCSCICLFVCLSRFVYRVCLLREWQIKCVFFYCAIVKCLSFSLPPLVCVRICLLLLTYLLTYSLLFGFVAFHPMLLFCLLWFDIFSRIKIKSSKFRKRLELERICYCNFGKKKTGSFNWSEFNIIT